MGRVLVVDDEEGVRSFVAEALELSGHEVRQAPDGLAATALLGRWSPQVVVTDLAMPNLGGMELLALLQREHPEVETLVLTAHGSVQNAVEAMRAGAFDFIQKPVSGPAELRLLVERALEHHRLRTRQEAQERTTEGPELTWGAAAMAQPVAALRRVATTDATVLLLGESGVGKEVAARALHAWSPRAAGPFVAINCAALSQNLLESELFGHERGAFTGADRRQRGRLELAAGGTFFLDEVGELDASLQARLLRVLQERRFTRVGGHQELEAEVRWVAATNRDLTRMVQEGRFRADLLHRLALFPVQLPPLRERREDLPQLADRLLQRIGAQLGRRLTLSESAQGALQGRDWPGNVRELANALERAAILTDGEVLEATWLGDSPMGLTPSPAPADGPLPTLEQAEKALIERALDKFDGNRRQVATALGIAERTLYDKLKRHGLR